MSLSTILSARHALIASLCGWLILLTSCAAPLSVAPVAEATVVPTASPAAEEAALFPLTITDALGQEFTFDAPPKIGCDWYGCYEALADLGLPPYAAALAEEEIDAVFYAPAGPPEHLITDSSNPENWAAAEIDLYMTRVPDNTDLDAMRQVAPVFFLHHPSYGESAAHGYAAYLENLRILGQLTGQPAAADAAIARFETVLATLKSLAIPETAALRVAVLFGGEGYGGLAPNNPFCATLAEVGLGQCVEAAEGESWLDVNAEQFLTIDPDWIVYMGFGDSYADRTDPVWSQLTAMKEGRVFDAAGSRYYCCSVRGLIHSLQDYVSHILPDSGIPTPGPIETFNPTQSPLATATATSISNLFPLTITDATGQEFTFDAPPKIGCMFYGCYETLADLGVTPQASLAGNPADRGANFYTPGPAPVHLIDDFQNPELWAAAEVDLIVVSAPADPANDALAQAAPLFHIYYLAGGADVPVGLAAFLKNLELLGQVTGQPEAAAAAIARYEQALAKLRTLATPETAALKVALLRSREGYQIYGDQNAFCTVILDAGLGQCLGEGDFVNEISPEELLALDPDWIIYFPRGDSYQDRSDPVWLELTAVKENRVYDAVSNRYGCCSVRGLYQPLIEYVYHILPDTGAPELLSTADFDPENNWLVNPE